MEPQPSLRLSCPASATTRVPVPLHPSSTCTVAEALQQPPIQPAPTLHKTGTGTQRKLMTDEWLGYVNLCVN